MQSPKRLTVYLERDIHDALRSRDAALRCSVSALANDALHQMLGEDADDLAAFDELATEPEASR